MAGAALGEPRSAAFEASVTLCASHSHSLTLSLSHSHFHSHSHSPSLTPTLTRTLIHTQSHSHTHTHPHASCRENFALASSKPKREKHVSQLNQIISSPSTHSYILSQLILSSGKVSGVYPALAKITGPVPFNPRTVFQRPEAP